MGTPNRTNVHVPRSAKVLSWVACVLVFGTLPFEFADWGYRGILGTVSKRGWETFIYGGCVMILAHVLTIWTWVEITGKHVRKTSTKGYCLIQTLVALSSIAFFEMSFLNLKGLPAARAWEAGQICSVVAATVYTFSISRQLREAN